MMKDEKIKIQVNWQLLLPACLAIGVFLYFYFFVYITSYGDGISLFGWIKSTWTSETEYEHGWAVPILFFVFIWMKRKNMLSEPVKPSLFGLFIVFFGILCYLASARTLQPRLAFFGLPFLIVGSVQYIYGWRVARHILFAAFFWYFAIPMPGLQQATNALQLVVTNSSYLVGTAFGMDLIHSGNEIRSATGSWDALDIAEGCSGIRSLMALVMISAVYAYFSQKSLWKMAFLFACALPLALVANFFRIFTIIVIAEMGHSEFAAGVYHDWAGLLFFFPIALAGLFLVDRLLNWKDHKKVARKRIQK